MIFSEKAFYNKFLILFKEQVFEKPIRVFWFLAIVIAIIMLNIHGDYGLTNDEPIHQAHGEVVLSYFQGNDSLAALSPIDSTGNLIKTFSTVKDENFRGMNFFGGFFDLIVNILHSSSESNIYDFRHLINAIFGFLIFVFIGLTVKEILGWKAAILALLFAVLSPRLFGHSFANPKDIPFAALYIIGIHQVIVLFKNLPRIKILNAFFLILIIGISISIRVSGILLIPYIFLAFAIWWINEFYNTRNLNIKSSIFNLFGIFGISIFGYLSTMLFWPYASTDLLAPLKVLIQVSNFNVFNAYEIFKGTWYNAWELPLSYVPTWIWISIPLYLNLGILILGLVFFKTFRKKLNILIYSLLIFFTFFPVVYIMLKGSNIYNGIRHLLFIFPPLIVISTIAWYQVLKYLKPTNFYYASLLILIGSMAQPLIWSIKAHPYEAMYFSPLVGGNNAVFANYETDYWGISTKEAVEWIAENTIEERKEKVVSIKMYYGDRIKVENYSQNYENLVFFPGNAETGWDYEIIYLSAAKFNKSIRSNWPPENTVYEIKANELPLAAVVKNKYAGLSLEQIANKYPTATNYIKLSLDYYSKGEYINAYNSSKKAYQLNNNNELALNNMGASANALQLYEVAFKDLSKCLELKPDFILAINNLKVAADGKMEKRDRSKLLNLSLLAYQIGEYEQVVYYSKEIIKLNSNDAIAWNNLCSALNAIGKHKEAAKACEKSLSINPDFQLAKNNLNYSKSFLGK